MIRKRRNFHLQSSFELEQRVYRSIRAGHIGRNSLVSGSWSELETKLSLIESDVTFSFAQRIPTRGFTIMGISGIGKWRVI